MRDNKISKRGTASTPFGRWVYAQCQRYNVSYGQLGLGCGLSYRQMRRYLSGEVEKLPMDIILTVVDTIAAITQQNRTVLLDSCLDAITYKWRNGTPTVNVDRVQLYTLQNHWRGGNE